MEKKVIENGVPYWLINIDADEVFNRVSLESAYRENGMESGGNRFVLLEDDRALFALLFRSASDELWLRMGRMAKKIFRGVKVSEDAMQMKLEVSGNHDDNMMDALGGFAGQFIGLWVLRQWYERCRQPEEAAKCARDAETALSNAITLVHYRKQAVRRPVDPLF